MKKIALLFLIPLLFACADPLAPYISFEEASGGYLARYGLPEETTSFYSPGFSSIDWWWWTKGHEVTFVEEDGDHINGWRVYSTYDFAPIR